MSKTLAFTLFAGSMGLGGCATKQSRDVAAIKDNNIVVIPAGYLKSEGYSWMSNYVIDKATKECFTQLTMYSVVKTDCVKLKAVPEAAAALKEIGI